MMVQTMPRRFNRGKRPINSIKHIVDNQGGLVAGTNTQVTLIDAVDAPVLATANQVITGSRVNAIFLNVQVSATQTSALANVYFYLAKNAGSNIVGTSFPDGNVTGVSDFKKLIFHTEMIMTEKNTTAIPRTIFKGILMIPKHMRRMGHDDIIQINLFSPGVTFEYCVQCIYKEYR